MLDPVRKPVGDKWTHVEEITEPVFDKMIRQAGWHFMWMQGCCSRRGFGQTQEEATDRAVASALKGIQRRFNAAELESVQFTRFPGFHIAHVILRPRQIQRLTSLDADDEKLQLPAFAR
jgi:hypothetical protein